MQSPAAAFARLSPSAPRAAVTDVVIVLAAAGAAFAIELAAAGLLPWGDEARGVLAVLVAAVAALTLNLVRGGSPAALGLRRPRRWWTLPFRAIGIFAAFVAAQGIVPTLVSAFFELPEPDFSRYDAIRGNLPAALAMAAVLPLAAAIPEEIVYRGFLMHRFTLLFGAGIAGTMSSVLLQALIFGAIHFQWGVGGVLFATMMGLVWGIGFVLCGRNLWVVIAAHSLAHVALVTQLYFSAPPP